MKRLLLLVAAALLLFAAPSYASHTTDPQTCDVTIAPPADVDAAVEAAPADSVVCLSPGTYISDPGNGTSRFSFAEVTHKYVRNIPGMVGPVLNGQVRVESSTSDLTFFGITFNGSGSGIAEPSMLIGGSNHVFQRVTITNNFDAQAGSCVHTFNSNPGNNVLITRARIFDCGFDAEHDHCVYLGRSVAWTVSQSWIYECASRVIATHAASTDALIHRNVLAQGCAMEGIGPGGCSTNVQFSQGATRDVVQNNTVAYPYNSGSRYNIDDYDSSAFPFTGTDNVVKDNCLWSDNTSDRARLGPLDLTHFADVSGNFAADPQFTTSGYASYTSIIHAMRDYTIPSSSGCDTKEPGGPVGAPK